MKQKNWFKRNVYNLNIIPCTWQGYLTVIFFVVFNVVLFTSMEKYPSKRELIEFYFYFFTTIMLFLYIINKKGEEKENLV
ncbi:MAG: hypothetical protein AB7V77_04235 [Candidatus Woesearchaeota archaeon]